MFLLKTLLVAASLTAAALGWPPTAGQSEPPDTLPRIARQLVGDGAPGAIAVLRSPSGIHSAKAGVARRRPMVAMSAQDRFRVASITKTFVATVVLQLVDEGLLGLDDSVERWLPGLLPNGSAITIRRLLDHTSGLPDYMADRRFVKAVLAHPRQAWPPRKLVAIATRHAPQFAPGRGWWYSNTNYVVLGLVVEAATGAPIEEELRRRLLQPLRLTRTELPRSPELGGLHAHGYIGFATLPRLQGSLVDATSAVTPSIAWAAGAIVSDGNDVTRFYAALLGGRLLPAPLLAGMKSPVPGASYGLGLMAVNTWCGRAYGHVGIAAGYRTVVYARPDGSRVALVMINVDGTYVAQGELEAAAETAFCTGA